MERKEAIEVIKKNWPDSSFTRLREALETLIPELKESEDERIRKSIIGFLITISSLKDGKTVSNEDFDSKAILEWVSWLEKQGRLMKALQISNARIGELIEENYYLKEQLEKQGEQMPKHFELKAGHWYICHRAFCCRADHLTVKEGERFMCEKDGVVKGFVIKEPEKYFREVCAPAPMENEQKPWSEEDENINQSIIDVLTKQGFQTQVNWLKFIKDRVQPLPQQEWSEEDIATISRVISIVKWAAYSDHSHPILNDKGATELIEGLKSLKDRYTWKPSDEQMNILAAAIEESNENSVLESLYQDLKKL